MDTRYSMARFFGETLNGRIVMTPEEKTKRARDRMIEKDGPGKEGPAACAWRAVAVMCHLSEACGGCGGRFRC